MHSTGSGAMMFVIWTTLISVAVVECFMDFALFEPGLYANEDLDMAEDFIMRATMHIHDCERRALTLPADCEDIYRRGNKKSGTYEVWPRNRVFGNRSLTVYCDMNTDGGGWTVIQRRGDFNNQEDYFFKNWECYKEGFGNIEKEFWLGNDAIFALSNQKQYSIRFDLGDFEGNRANAVYDQFWIENEEGRYTIRIQGYKGNAGDSMKVHNGHPFSTKSRDNDDKQHFSCADTFKGAWWYSNCHQANLNGLYRRGEYNETFADGVVWYTWRGYQYSLKDVEIKIRSSNFRRNYIQASRI